MPARRGRKTPRAYSQRVEDLANELGVDLDTIEGTGSRGRITARDVLNVGLPGGAEAPDAEPESATETTSVEGDDAAAEVELDPVEDAAREPSAEELDVQPDAVEETAEADSESSAPTPAFPTTSGRPADELSWYAGRLERAGVFTLAKVIRDYSTRVDGVRQGRLPASAAVVPAGIDPGMVGKTLAAGSTRRAIESFVEVVRNVLIFLPVLVTWWKIQGSGVNDLGDMRDTALQVVILIVVLIAVHVLLGLLRQNRTSRGERISRDFAAALTNASMEASAQQAETTEAAIAGFAQAGRELTASLQGAGESLRDARDVMTRMADVVARQGEQVDGLMELLKPISRIGDQLGGAHRELSTAAATMSTTARTLSEIEKNIAPTAGQLGDTARELGDLAQQLDVTGKHLGRMTEVFAERFDPMDQSAAHFEEAVKQLNLVTNRVAEALEVLQQARDGTRSRVGG